MIFFDGSRFVATEEGSSNSESLIRFLKDVKRKCGKTFIIVYHARTHASKAAKEFLRKTKDTRLFYLPKGAPFLNAIEKLRHPSKHDALV